MPQGQAEGCQWPYLHARAVLLVLLAAPFQTAKVLVSGIPSTGSNVPVAETAPCPPNYYRQEVIIFACGEQGGEVYFPLANVSKAAFRIPKGIRNLKLTLDASGPVDITLVDPATKAVVSNGTESTATWNDVTIKSTTDPSSLGTKEGVSFTGVFSSTLRVDLANRLQSQTLASITYSYDDYEGCPEIPHGCEKYDQVVAREWVYNWSTWVSMQYPKAAQAWQALASKAMRTQYGSSARAGPIPFHLWKGVWAKWPGAAAMDWQVAFKFIDSLHTEDQLVEVVEFIRAYKIAGVGLSMYSWCTALQTQYPDASTAWAAVAGVTYIAGIDYSRWKSAVWPSFVPPDHFAKASAAGSFQFADLSNNGVVSKSEFDTIYTSCDYKPSSYAKRAKHGRIVPPAAVSAEPKTTTFLAATSTTTSQEASTSLVSTTTQTTTVANASSNANATAKENHTAELGAAAPGSTQASTSASTSTSSSATTTTTQRSVSVTSTAACCDEANADCLACKAGLSQEDFCSGSQGVGVRGCPDAELADEHEEPKQPAIKPSSPLWRATPAPSPALPDDAKDQHHVSDCPYPGISYAPNLEGVNETTEVSFADCQVRCARLAGCAFFSYRAGGTCGLHGPAAVWSLTTEVGAVAGPAVCVARVNLHVSDVDFGALTDSQKRRILESFAARLANVSEVDVSAVKDLAGLPARVTLSSGSLLVNAWVELPAGTSVSQAQGKFDREVVAEQLIGELRAATQEAPGAVGESSEVRTTLEVSQGCFLPGTRFDAPSEHEDGSARLSLAESGSTGNASECQASCLMEEGCEYFTFIPTTGTCLLRGGSAVVAIHDEKSVGGPRECAGLPVVPFHDWGGYRGGASGFNQVIPPSSYMWCWILGMVLGLCSLGTIVLVLWSRQRKRKRSAKVGGHRYAPLSRQDDEDGEGSQSMSPASNSGPSWEEDSGTAWLEVDVHPLSMEPAEDSDSREEGYAGRAGRDQMQLALNSRELRNAHGEATESLMHGFLGTEALRREA